MNRRISFAFVSLAFAVVFTAIPLGAATAQTSTSTSADTKLSAFCGDFDRMDVAFVMDQSASLKGTDPGAERLDAGVAYIENLAALPQDVSVNVSGFGDSFTSGRWLSLDSEGGVDQAVDALNGIVHAPLQQHTDYVLALQGALDLFEDRTAEDTCRVFVWFTDGEHDLTPPDSKPRPYQDNLDQYEVIVGPELAPLLTQKIETDQDAAAVQDVLEPLTCDAGGFGDQLVNGGIFSQVLLLDSTGAVADDPSWKVIQRMLKGGADCGTHGIDDPGESFTSDSLDELIWNLSCPPQVPGTVVSRVQSDSFPLTLGEAAPGVAIGLISSVFVSALGSEGLELQSTSSSSSSSSGSISNVEQVFSVESPPSPEWSAVASSGTIDRACVSVTVAEPRPVVVGDEGLRTGEPGGYNVEVSGPFGTLTSSDLDMLTIDASPGERSAVYPPRWEIDQVPADLVVSGTVSGTGFEDKPFTETLNVLPERGFPSISLVEPFLTGVGAGPFEMPVTFDAGDGGELCLEISDINLIDEDGTDVPGTVAFSEGGSCVTDFEDAPEALVVTFNDSAIVPDGTFTLEFISRADGREVTQKVHVPTTLTRAADNVQRLAVFAAVLLLILFMFWLVLYLVNRRSVRVPSLRHHRWYQFDAASHDAIDQAMQGVDLNLTKRPTSTASEFVAGPLVGRRHVPVVRVWRRPSIDLTLGGAEFAASIGSRFRRSANGRISVTRGDIANGQIVVLPDEGEGSTGVLFTRAPRAGSNAETEFLRQLSGGVQDIRRQRNQYTNR